MRRLIVSGRRTIPLWVLLGITAAAVLVLGSYGGLTGRANAQVAGYQMTPPPAYSQMCVECHAKDASGTGPEWTEHFPHPANLSLVRDTPAMATSIIHNGVQGTAMPAFPNVSSDTASSVLSYIMAQPPDTNTQWDYAWTVQPSSVNASMAPTIYITACMDCHGPRGGGDGEWARNDPHIWPKPADFRSRNSDIGRLYYIISQGREGTMMAPQDKKFPENARWALAQYVYSLYVPNSNGTIPTGPMERYTNPYQPSNKSVVQRGSDTYDLYCAYCHNAGGKGTFLAPMLIDREWRYGGGTDNAVFVVITKGIPGKLMPPHPDFAPERRWEVITFLRSQGGEPAPMQILADQRMAQERKGGS